MKQIRLGLKQKLDVSYYANPKYTWLQMAQIFERTRRKKIIMTNISNQLNIHNLLKTKWSKQFNQDQLDQINLGIKNGIDVTIYAKPEFYWEQMFEIRLGLKQKLDVSIYANPIYNKEQMEQIRLGLEHNIDVSSYANSKYDWGQMRNFRFDLESELNND